MAWIVRGDRGYRYRSVRRGGKVTSEYVADSATSADSAGFYRWLDDGRRAERRAERAAWEDERGRLEEAERRADEADASYQGLAEAAMVAAGYHRPKRDRWRRRRPMATEIEAREEGPPPVTAAEMGDLLDAVDRARAEGRDKKPHQQAAWDAVQVLVRAAGAGDDRAMPALRVVLDRRPTFFAIRRFGDTAIEEAAKLAASDGDLLNREVIARQIAAMRDELAGPDGSTLERALAERVALAWYDAHRVEMNYAAQEMAGVTLAKAKFLSRQRSRAQARFLAAARSLATVRRLALPVLHLHKDVTPPAQPASTGDRLRVLAGDVG